MTGIDRNLMTHRDFEHLLEVYGGNRRRWPADAAAAADALLAADGEARALLDEAAALDRVLAKTPVIGDRRLAALTDRIVNDARRSPRIVAVGQRSTDRPQVVTPSKSVRPTPTTTATFRTGGQQRSVAVLAASLLFGLFVGQTQISQHALPVLEELTGVTIDHASGLVQVATEEWDED